VPHPRVPRVPRAEPRVPRAVPKISRTEPRVPRAAPRVPRVRACRRSRWRVDVGLGRRRPEEPLFAPVGDLFSNAMSQEQGNIENVNR
jgi:hypothetical protein